jgi:hypothetical protein
MPQGPLELDAAIARHKEVLGAEPDLIMLRDTFVNLFSYYFKGRLHQLCCGKGLLYEGIPAIITSSAMVEDFLICY